MSKSNFLIQVIVYGGGGQISEKNWLEWSTGTQLEKSDNIFENLKLFWFFVGKIEPPREPFIEGDNVL